MSLSLLLCNHCSVCISRVCFLCIPSTSISGMQEYSWKEGRTVLAVFIKRPCSDSIQMLRTAAWPLGLPGWASWGPYCELRLMKLLWSTWRTLRPGTSLYIPMEFSMRRMQRVQRYRMYLHIETHLTHSHRKTFARSIRYLQTEGTPVYRKLYLAVFIMITVNMITKYHHYSDWKSATWKKTTL